MSGPAEETAGRSRNGLIELFGLYRDNISLTAELMFLQLVKRELYRERTFPTETISKGPQQWRQGLYNQFDALYSSQDTDAEQRYVIVDL